MRERAARGKAQGRVGGAGTLARVLWRGRPGMNLAAGSRYQRDARILRAREIKARFEMAYRACGA
jgi:hypothetical protein